MAQTAWTSAGSVANNAGVGTLAWTNPGNATTDNATRATRVMSGTAITNYLLASTFGFAIPSGATIDGIEVQIDKSRTGGATGQVRDNVVRLVKGGTVSGNNKADTATAWVAQASEAYVAYGASNDLWGVALTDTDVNASTFGVVIAAAGNVAGTDRTAQVDDIQIRVTYTLPLAVVTLNSPADASTTSDTTPTLEFTGDDPEGDSLSYNVQIDTINTFDSQGTSAVLVDSYSETNNSINTALDNANTAYAQAFTGNGGTLGTAQFHLAKVGTPTGTAVAKLYAHSGTFGTTSLPTGSALATSGTINVASLTLSPALNTFTFTGVNQVTLTNGTKYCIAIEYTSGTISNYITAGADSSSPTHAGNAGRFSGGVWNVSVADICFYVYTPNTSGPLLNKLSGTDSGFVNTVTGGDTDPFNDNEKVSYTVQAGDALAVDTYYWRVRAIDPGGGNVYGNWSSTRSFEITAGGTDVTTNPSAQVLTTSQPSPTVTAIRNVSTSPNAQALTSSQPSPTVTAVRNVTTSPSAQALTLSAETIGIAIGDGATPAPQEVTLDLPAPTVTTVRNLTTSPLAQTLTTSQASPTVVISADVTTSPNAQALTASQASPTVTAVKNVSISPNPQTLTTAQETIAITVGDGATPAPMELSLSQPSPTVSTIRNVSLAPDPQTLTGTQPTPSVAVSDSISADAQTATVSVVSPTVTAIRNVITSPNEQSLTTSQASPTVSTVRNVTVSPSAQTLTIAEETPTLSVGDGATPAPQEITLAQPSPTVSTVRNVTVSPGVQVLTSTIIDPTVTTRTDVEVSVGVLTATVVQNSPTTILGAHVTINMPVLQLGGRRGHKLIFIEGRPAISTGGNQYVFV